MNYPTNQIWAESYQKMFCPEGHGSIRSEVFSFSTTLSGPHWVACPIVQDLLNSTDRSFECSRCPPYSTIPVLRMWFWRMALSLACVLTEAIRVSAVGCKMSRRLTPLEFYSLSFVGVACQVMIVFVAEKDATPLENVGPVFICACMTSSGIC
jgi:hypothetical protein